MMGFDVESNRIPLRDDDGIRGVEEIATAVISRPTFLSAAPMQAYYRKPQRCGDRSTHSLLWFGETTVCGKEWSVPTLTSRTGTQVQLRYNA
jgi:hypothetical protein